MAINFLDNISVGNSTISSTTSTLYLLNLTRNTTSLTTVGSVGIGTTSPDSKLEVIGDYKQKAADGNSQGFTLSINSSTDAVSLNNYYNASMIFSTNNSAKMTILGSGNVGIGNTSPAEKLDVAGNIKTTGKIQVTPTSGYGTIEIGGPSGGFIDLKGPSTDDYDLRIISGGSGGSFWTGGYGHVMTLNSSGNVGIGTTAPVAKLQVNGTFTSTGVSNIGGGANTSVYLTASSGTGKVGVGTTSPAEKLDVNGNVKASGYKTSSGTGVTTNVTVRNQNNSNTVTFQIVGGIIVGIT